MAKRYVRVTTPSAIERCEHAYMEIHALHRRLKAERTMQREALLQSVADSAELLNGLLTQLRTQRKAA